VKGREGARGRVSAKDALEWLERRGTRKNVEALKRYAITATRPFGVTVGDLRRYAKGIGTDHALAQKLWKSGRYEARLLAAFVGDPGRITAREMDGWAADFDNWAIVDTLCFCLFDRTPHAWRKVRQWADAGAEFTKRAAFALLWSLSVHDKDAPDERFRECLSLVEKGARDDRNFVKKAVDMAVRAVGKRNAALNAAAVATARRLAASDEATPRWIGRHALRELESPAVRKRLAGR
jgi:3-methyladenine DNA glycosylase AlkD